MIRPQTIAKCQFDLGSHHLTLDLVGWLMSVMGLSITTTPTSRSGRDHPHVLNKMRIQVVSIHKVTTAPRLRIQLRQCQRLAKLHAFDLPIFSLVWPCHLFSVGLHTIWSHYGLTSFRMRGSCPICPLPFCSVTHIPQLIQSFIGIWTKQVELNCGI